MLNRFLILLVVSGFVFSVEAQVHKRFFDKNGKQTKDSTRASSYMLYQKESPDSVWSVVVLDKQNIPSYRGFFLDDDLTVPHGKFIKYHNIIEQDKIDDHHSKIDTVFRISSTGFFNNGKAEGIWMDYYSNGIKQRLRTFEDDKLNGLYEEYYYDGKLESRSNYINSLREGDSYTLWPDSSIKTYAKFWHGNMIDYKDYTENDQMFNAYPGFNFEYYVSRYLKKTGLTGEQGKIMVEFTVDTDGKLIKPELQIGINPTLDTAIVEAIKNSPAWVPAKRKHQKVEQKITLAFEYNTTAN